MKPPKTVKTSKVKKDKNSSAVVPYLQSQQIEGLMRLMTHDTGKSIQFEITAEQGSKVYVAGTFNNWDPTTHPLNYHPEEGVFKATLHLPAGQHEYKFVVNGVWQCDGKRSHGPTNEHGTTNSAFKI